MDSYSLTSPNIKILISFLAHTSDDNFDIHPPMTSSKLYYKRLGIVLNRGLELADDERRRIDDLCPR